MKLPKGPKISLPKRGERAPKSASAAAKRPSVQPPAFVSDVYRDLRDRRLLLPALVLAVALLAVPLMLRSSAETPLPAAPPANAEGATAVEPAVLAEQLGGVRDYRKRLDALKKTNPFKQQHLIPPPVEEAVESVGDAPADPVGGSGSTPPPDTSTSTGTAPVGTGSTEPPAPAEPPKEPKPEVKFYAPRMDVVVAHDGERKKYEDVRPGQLLPGRETPVAMFLGSPLALDSARFAISSKVTATDGDGHCAPSADNCQFVRLGIGEKRVFEYGAHGLKYSILVRDIRRQLVDQKKAD